MSMKEAAAIAGALTQELDPKANVIWGARIRPELAGRVRLMAIITGVKSAQVLSAAPSQDERQILQRSRKKIDEISPKLDMIR